MLFSYHWLKELTGTKKSPRAVADLLMTHAFEVESVAAYTHELDDIVIGQVLSVKPHPNADRLRVTTVQVGKKDIRPIVCGAPNVAVNQKVAVVLPGGSLPGGHTIEAATLRGETSDGMICSAQELGLGDEHRGILVLPADAPIGKSFARYSHLDDTVLDIKILPDRAGDVLSYRGMAREIAALEGVRPAFENQQPNRFRTSVSSAVPKITLKSKSCERYVLAAFKNLGSEVTTPLLMRARLLISGIRPISPVVDVTNYLMLETGQPLHAFDLDAIGKGGVVVREAKPRETLLLLDGKKVVLGKEDLVIADAKKPLALAGVMGGKHSGITEKTKRVAIEIAHFHGTTIRKTRKRMGVETDASYHFERGIDKDRPGEVLPLLTRLMEDVCRTDFLGRRDIYPRKAKPRSIRCREEDVEALLGIKIPLFEMVQYLALLGLTVKKVANRKEIVVTIPVRRSDLRDPEDLIEEIGRMKGYANIKAVAPVMPLVPVIENRERSFERRIQTILRSLGFDEVLSYSFYSEKDAVALDLKQDLHLRVANPMNPDQALMRATLLPTLLHIGRRNMRNFRSIEIFELGRVFSVGSKFPEERGKIGLLAIKPVEVDDLFLCEKGKLEMFFDALGISVSFIPLPPQSGYLAHGQGASLQSEGAQIGVMGVVSKKTLRAFGLETLPVIFIELEVEMLQGLVPEKREIHPLPKFPFAHRDISLIGKSTLRFAEVNALLHEAGQPLLQNAELFDVYRSTGEVSYAFHLTFGHRDRTLTSEETEACFQEIVTQAGSRLGMRLRLS